MKLPSALPLTFTVTVQVLFAAMLALDNEITRVPATAVTVPPTQVVLALGGVATTSPTGSVSEKLTPVSACAGFGNGESPVLLKLNVRVDMPVVITIGLVPNDFVIDGGGKTEHPVKTIVSYPNPPEELSLLAPLPESLKIVLPDVLVKPVKSKLRWTQPVPLVLGLNVVRVVKLLPPFVLYASVINVGPLDGLKS